MTTPNDTAAPLAASVPTPMALRAELEDLIRKDLLGPAGGETEEIDRALGNPRDRYLVLDMKALAELDDAALFASLDVLPAAYRDWVAAQRARVPQEAEGLKAFEAESRAAMEACEAAAARIAAGIALLKSDAQALAAFRFANRAMWQQRVHSMLSEGVRAGRTVTLPELDVPAARSWRPFQLAFVLLNLPGITQLDHPERSSSPDALADLLWFPTGGGKTEAYLGLTA